MWGKKLGEFGMKHTGGGNGDTLIDYDAENRETEKTIRTLLYHRCPQKKPLSL
jgi:mevalonate kinase